MRFKSVAEIFDDMAHRRMCESRVRKQSPENTMNLSDLVDSFIENDSNGECNKSESEFVRDTELDDCERLNYESDLKETLIDLFGSDRENDELERIVVSEIEEAYRFAGISATCLGFKRYLMTRLRERGFNAGLCNSKWDKNGHIPAGSYEYIDINISGTRHIIEVNLANQFEIARPTKSYSSLLQNFPQVFIGKFEDFKRIIRLMCNAIKLSMKRTGMALPPWRRYGYMLVRWFGSYKRTINDLDSDDDLVKKKSVGFVPLGAISYYCRGDFATRIGFRMGKLATEMNGNNNIL